MIASSSDLLNPGRNVRETGQTRRAQTPLAGDQLVTGTRVADEDGVQDTSAANRFGEVLHLLVVEVASRLTGVGDDLVNP